MAYASYIELLLIFLENFFDVWNKGQSTTNFVFPEIITLLNLDMSDNFPFF